MMNKKPCNIDRKGTIAIHQDDEYQKPEIVFIGGVNRFDMLVCYVLNSESIVFSKPEENDLLDFDMALYKDLKKEWKIKNLEKQLRDLEDKNDE